MAKPMPNNEHHPNCNCCGKQAPFIQSARKPSGFGPLQSTPSPKKSTPHTASKSPERASTGVDRRKSLQHGNEANPETSLEDTFNKLVSGDHTSANLATDIAEEVADRAMLQAKESRMKRTSQDKESLLEECSNLNNASIDQLYHLRLHKVHHESVYLEQRKIEVAIEELEMANGLEAPRTGGHSRLNSKLLGLKCRQQEYFSILTTLRIDLETLKKDPQVSLTKEADVERDIFASEIRRLQKMVRQLRKFYHKVCAENNDVLSLREDIAKFTVKLTNAQISLKDKKSMIDQMKTDTDRAKSDAIEAQKLARNATYKAGELESHSVVLKDMLTSEKQEGSNIHKQTSTLSEQTRDVKKENAERETAAKVAAMTAAIAAEAESAAKGAGAAAAGKGAKMGGFKGSPSPYGSDEDSASMGSDGMDSKGERDGTDSANSKDGQGGRGGRGGKGGKGGDRDGANSANSEDGRGGKGGKRGKLGKGKTGDQSLDMDGAREAYLKEIRLATTKFVESAPTSRSGSPTGKAGSPTGSPDGGHSEYKAVRDAFQQNTSDSEDRFLSAMDEVGYGGGSRPNKRNAREQQEEEEEEEEEERKLRVAAELEALKKASSTQAAWLQNFTIQLDDQVLLPHEYVIDVQDSKTNVRITSLDKTPEALAAKKKKAEAEEARKRKEAEEARQRAQEEEEVRIKKAAREEEERKKKALLEDAASNKASLELEAKKKKKDAAKAAKKAQQAEGEAAAKAATDLAAKASGSGKEFFDDEMQGVIKQNIKQVLGHLETITESVQQKATASGTAESTAKDVLDKLEKPK